MIGLNYVYDIQKVTQCKILNKSINKVQMVLCLDGDGDVCFTEVGWLETVQTEAFHDMFVR